jgi:hypothetical protein
VEDKGGMGIWYGVTLIPCPVGRYET